MSPSTPINIALVNDYDVVLAGLQRMLERFSERVRVCEIDANTSLGEPVDVVLYDNFAQPESDHDEIDTLIAHPLASEIIVYTWNFHDELVAAALQRGASGYLSKTLTGAEIVDCIEAVHAGNTVVRDAPRRPRSDDGLEWPGRREGLTDREAEILALITQGKSNDEISKLTFLSPNTIKSYIRVLYRKLGVGSRTQAVLWGIDHGFSPDHRRLEFWRTRPS